MKMILPENCKVKEIIILCHLFAITNSKYRECNNSEKTLCCPNFKWNEKNSTCIPKSITSTISRGPRMTEKSTSLVVTHSQTLKDENGGKNCTNKKKHRIFPTTVVSVMIASFATIFGLFLIFYLGLHYCVKKQNPNRAVF
uniref:Uncharacterized protein LOC111105545 isoform X2 n=1 Tax=Crassostrea virginica TaxID=6565 RepID=A0A8B8AWG9_CRAVI|nr:uncharacterized protein LOC111105545 isoform X2 [Crassostrea virginica]